MLREARDSVVRRARSVAARRHQVPGVDAAFQLYERDEAIHGAIFASAVAFRLFLWTLPLSLVVVGGLGFLQASGTSTTKALHQVGISAISASSISSSMSASSKSRWWATIVGLVFLYPTSVAVAKVVHRSHAVAWGDEHKKLRSNWRAAAFVIVSAAGLLVLTGIASRVRTVSGPGAVARIALFGLYVAAWLGVSRCLPHRDAPWTALIPGAVLVAAGNSALHIFVVVYLARHLTSATQLYGALGAAAVLLSFLYLIGRLSVASAALNATLWDRRLAGAASPFPRIPLPRRHRHD